VHAQQFPNPLGDYLESLAKVRDLGTDEVLPAHEYRFADLDSRIDQISAHHADRLDEIMQVIADHPGSTAWEITLRLHWSRPWDDIEPFMQCQANGETLAHCVLLELREQVQRKGDSPALFFLFEH
jgi:glyoxylase-like metal-dependent hydrolase (beta-lactamase superfamily II)